MNTLNTPHAATHPGLQLRGLLMPCVRSAVFVALVTGVLYPLATTGVRNSCSRIKPTAA